MTASVDKPQLVSIGYLGRTFGLKGWVWLNCDANTYIFNCKKVWLKLRGESEWVLKAAFQAIKRGSRAILFFPDFCDKESATRLNGAVVAIKHDVLEPLPLGTNYWCDLQGLKVITSGGNDLGYVKALIETGANDVLILEQSGVERLIPFIRQVILRVDLKEGVIVADWDPGF